MDRPRVKTVNRIPPAIAIDRTDPVRTSRSTVGTMTEVTDYVKLLFARLGVLHGTKSFVLQTPDGQIAETHSISAGLDYPSVGPEHAWLRDEERAGYTYATDEETLAAVQLLSEMEGIIPALESAHAVAHARKLAPRLSRDAVLVLCLSGRGDKDAPQVRDVLRARAGGSH